MEEERRCFKVRESRYKEDVPILDKEDEQYFNEIDKEKKDGTDSNR